ncbi:AAA family ATPase [Methylobacterium sp. Leaf88]|uniref:ATP-binding protein n=1 Tax=Methylobacterium sp. Leaf88 TaxID=1736244 RepID=UPI00138F7F98|nr:AAA family ATPase [Methylobacterium sp. Leaf88]
MLLGISGVGKSFLTRQISEARPDLLCLSAGTLLRETLKADPEQLRTSNRDVILANQMLLSEAVRRARSGKWQQTAILEAHIVIDNGRELIKLPVEAFQSLDIGGIILVEDSVEHIKRRRETDARFRPDRSLDELVSQQQESSEAADRYAADLDAPIQKVSPIDTMNTLDFIHKLEESSRI